MRKRSFSAPLIAATTVGVVAVGALSVPAAATATDGGGNVAFATGASVAQQLGFAGQRHIAASDIASILTDGDQLKVGIDSAMVAADNRLVVRVDGEYVMESYAGRTYYSQNTTVGGVTTMSRSVDSLREGSVVEVFDREGVPGQTNTPGVLLASTKVGTITSAAISNDKLTVTMDEAAFRSATKYVIQVDGEYVAETQNGRSPYARNSTVDGVTTVVVSLPGIDPGAHIGVRQRAATGENTLVFSANGAR